MVNHIPFYVQKSNPPRAVLKIHYMKIPLYSNFIQCPHSEEEDSIATICGFENEFQGLKV